MDNAPGFSVGMFQAENRMLFLQKTSLTPVLGFRGKICDQCVPKRTQGTKLSVTVANAEKGAKKNELCSARKILIPLITVLVAWSLAWSPGKLQCFHWFVKPLSDVFKGNKINKKYLSWVCSNFLFTFSRTFGNVSTCQGKSFLNTRPW